MGILAEVVCAFGVMIAKLAFSPQVILIQRHQGDIQAGTKSGNPGEGQYYGNGFEGFHCVYR